MAARSRGQSQPINVLIDNASSVVLNPHEFSHIRHLATRPSAAADLHASLHDTSTADKRARLREQSRQRYTNWGNTLEALRSKKKQDRLSNLDEMERTQQVIDGEESHYAEAQRRIVIDRANRLLFQEKDKVKNFHSGLLLSSVMKEREKQIVLAAKKKEIQKEVDKKWVHYAEQDRLKAIEIEEKEEAERAEKSKQLATIQLEQLNHSRLRKAVERQEEIKDGERLRRIAMDSVIEGELEEQRKVDRQRAMNHEYLRANSEQRDIRRMLKDQEALEDSKIARFASEKERLTALRREHESAKFAAKQEMHEQMWRRQYAHLAKLQNNEKDRLERQIIEVQQRNDDAMAAKEAKAQREKEAMIKSREEQYRRRQAEKERQAEMDAVMAEEWKRRNREMEELEVRQLAAEKQASINLQEYLRQQMMDKEAKARLDVNKEYEEVRTMKEARAREDQVFQEYANTIMANTAAKGKSVTPMALVMHHENSNLRFFG